LDQSDALVIEHYEKLPNANRLNIEGKQIIAIADYAGNAKALDAMFAFIYTLPPLRERPEDVDLYAQYYQDEACQTLQITFASPPKITQLDLSHNHRSLRASIYREILLADSNRADLERSLYHYFIATLPDQADYHHHLGLLEKPLLEAGLKIYGSQLRLAEALGINRNTLRKKIHEHL
jgi:transcriptional regulator of acetoin/glycerol metabolism